MSLTVPADTNIDVINAKVHAQRAEMIEADRLARLCELRGFANLVAELFPERGIESHRQLQKRLVETHVARLCWIPGYLGGAAHELYSWLLRRYQIENLKVIFRGFHARRGPQAVIPSLISLPAEFALPAERLLGAPDVEGFAALVPDEPLKYAVKQSLRLYRKKERPFYFEAALDGMYYARLLRLADAPSAADLSPCRPLLVLDADIYLTALVLRAKLHYGTDLADIEPFLQVRHAIPLKTLRAMHAASELREAIQLLPKVLAKGVGGTVDTIDGLERQLRIHLHASANTAFYATGVSLAVPVAFYYLKRIELENLVRLSEAYRYDLSPEEMRRNAIPPLE